MEIAYPWMVDVVRPMNILHPYMVEVYVARDESEACLSPDPPKAFCTQVGAVKEVRLELAFSRYETYEDKTREVHRRKGLLAFTLRRKNTWGCSNGTDETPLLNQPICKPPPPPS